MFLAKHSPFIWLPWQQWMPYPQVFNFKKNTYIIVLKVRKFVEDRLKPFLRYLAKPSGSHFAPSPSANRVKRQFHLAYVSSSITFEHLVNSHSVCQETSLAWGPVLISCYYWPSKKIIMSLVERIHSCYSKSVRDTRVGFKVMCTITFSC